MGFRDIEAFNLAILAKQCWRLIHNTHSLFYGVYKSKYFPTCSFMEANLGNNPSYIWRSLLAAREVIREEGSIWKVKDGSLIQVSNHKWLPNRPMILGTPRPQMYVNELIDRATMQWDREKIFDLFAYRTRMDILSIPLGNNSARDVLVWKENKSQTFTVKSAYQVACKLKEATRVEHSTAASDRHIRSRMWKLNIPLKVWTFVWQECSNILPTRDNLHQKKLRVNPRCELCCQHHESTGHLLWECPFARNVWALCSGKIQKCSNEAQDFFLLFRTMVRRLPQAKLEKWAMVSWAIWNAWNKFYFEQVHLHPRKILNGALGYLEEYQHFLATHNSVVHGD